MTNVRIYVGTYNKYNNGSIYGKWIDLSNYLDKDELFTAMQELHKDEEDPEFMFQDWEGSKLFEDLNLIGESYLSPKIYEVIEAIEECSYDVEVIEAYIDCYGCGSTGIEEIISQMEESYMGEYPNDTDFTQTLLEDTGCLPVNLPSYVHIDWVSTSRDIMMDYSDSNNHYFRCH